MNWTALLAVMATLTAAAAVCSTVAIVRTLRANTQRAAFTAGLDLLGRFDTDWNGDSMAETRNAAAQALLDGRFTRDLDAVLDFFDQVALLVQRGALDEEMVWYTFYWPMANYWTAAEEHADLVQKDNPSVWEQLRALMPRMIAMEAQRRRRTAAEAVPTKAQMRQFFTDELSAGPCNEDEEEADAQRMPL